MPHGIDTCLKQGILTEGGRDSTVDLFIKTACFVKKTYITFSWLKGADVNLLVQGGQLY
jgi:hypothetical protein